MWIVAEWSPERSLNLVPLFPFLLPPSVVLLLVLVSVVASEIGLPMPAWQ